MNYLCIFKLRNLHSIFIGYIFSLFIVKKKNPNDIIVNKYIVSTQ